MGISIGMVGLGVFGRHFVKLFRDHPHVDRIALCDLEADRVAECSRQFEIAETYSSLDEICASDLDALVIITQHWMHAEQCIQAMNAGKHVYSAVPAAQSLEECDRLVQIVKRTGLIYMNGETTYFRPEAVFCRRKAQDGAFGQIVYCQAEYLHDLSHGLYEVARNRWGKAFGRDKTGGIPLHYPTHSVAFPVSVTGAHMTEVSAMGYVYPNDDWFRKDTISQNVFSNEVALFRMSNGATCRIAEFRRVGHPGCERVSAIYGTEGSWEQNQECAVWLTKLGSEVVKPDPHHSPLPEELSADLGGHGGSHAYLVHEFVDSVNRGRLPAINVWQAVRYAAPGLAAHRSALAGGELMKVPDWGDAPGQ